jgi:adenosylcobinamide-phosphate synthase
MPGHGIRDIERRLNREHRSIKARVVRGWIFTLFALFACIVFGLLLSWILQGNLRSVEMLLLACMLPSRSSWDMASGIRKALRANDLNAARQVLSYSVWKHHAKLDDHGLARAAIEILAVHFSEKIVAPVLFYILFGLPGFFISKIIYLMQETLLRPTESEQAFAQASHRLHYMLHYIPARVSALLWVCASIFVPSASFYESAEQVKNGLWGEKPQDVALLAAASVLRLSLGGTLSAYMHEGWVGAGTVRAGEADIKRAQRLYLLVQLLLFCFIGLFI